MIDREIGLAWRAFRYLAPPCLRFEQIEAGAGCCDMIDLMRAAIISQRDVMDCRHARPIKRTRPSPALSARRIAISLMSSRRRVRIAAAAAPCRATINMRIVLPHPGMLPRRRQLPQQNAPVV
jgi:hypothetical protein